MMKGLIKNVLRKCGYKITGVKEMQRGLHAPYLSRICQPKTVIDVGVGRGTPWLYQAYPTAKFILVEPLRDHESSY
jgi:16S rRNA G527 N7-methylase RsmG